MTDIPLPEPDDQSTTGRPDFLRRLQPVLTLVIAVSAIALASWEGLENRHHNRLTVQPRLDAAIGAGRDGTVEYVRIAVESTGLGPAVIKDFRIYFDGVLQDSSTTAGGSHWDAVIAAAAASEGTQINARSFGGGHYFPPGREYILFDARRPLRPSAGDVGFSNLLNRLAIQVCYCSVYGTNCDEVLLAVAEIETARCT